jgi:hypothetical protein
MEIKDILDSLGIDLSNPDARKGAMEAIDAILSSRIDLSGLGGGSGGNAPAIPTGPVEVELDPDLIQPSVKHRPPSAPGAIEIEDEENLLDKVKHNKSEDSTENDNSEGSSKGDSEEGDNEGASSEEAGEADESNSDTSSNSNNSDPEDSEMNSETDGETKGKTETESETTEKADPTEEAESEDEESSGKNTSGDDEEGFPDEEDWLDDDTKNATKVGDAEKKTESRKIKRARVLKAAKEALAKAQANKASKALISELENAIAALEALIEAAGKNIADLSDDEFNMMINRVFDAIDALGTGDLTYSTEEERQAKAQEIKADLTSTKTQAELSAEDAAAIRAETQAVKAREQEADKYRQKSRTSFQGFQAFMNSLQRGIALQVSYNEERDDTWSAISRRNSGADILRQGQKIKELPNKKIPVIDFYFDQSGSWSEKDLEIGNQAVGALAKLKADGKIDVNVYYFANNVHEKAEDARAEGGTMAWNEIIKNIVVTKATNVVIMTDGDMEHWWHGTKALKHTVSGFVWYLWRDGVNAPRLPRDLQGRGGTLQYSC